MPELQLPMERLKLPSVSVAPGLSCCPQVTITSLVPLRGLETLDLSWRIFMTICVLCEGFLFLIVFFMFFLVFFKPCDNVKSLEMM